MRSAHRIACRPANIARQEDLSGLRSRVRRSPATMRILRASVTQITFAPVRTSKRKTVISIARCIRGGMISLPGLLHASRTSTPHRG